MSYGSEWTGAPVVLGALFLLLIVPSFALIALTVVALAALAILLAFAGAIAATPYLLFRSVRSRWAQHVAGRRNAQPMRHGLKTVPRKEM